MIWIHPICNNDNCAMYIDRDNNNKNYFSNTNTSLAQRTILYLRDIYGKSNNSSIVYVANLSLSSIITSNIYFIIKFVNFKSIISNENIITINKYCLKSNTLIGSNDNKYNLNYGKNIIFNLCF